MGHSVSWQNCWKFLKNGGQKLNISHDPLAAERRTPGEWEERNN